MVFDPEEAITTIPAELDKADWNLEFDATDISVFSKFGACQAPVIGFKTITTHPVSAKIAFNLLKDVNKAMEMINDQFARGEVVSAWPSASDPEGSLVRTSFKMPWPMGNREFPHGLHCKSIDENTFIVAYTPMVPYNIFRQVGYIQCPIYPSGQRITELGNGSCRVEHLMVYELAGSISKSVQDKWMKKAHVGAYIKEWRKLREVLFPTKLEDINHLQLTRLALESMETSETWPVKKQVNRGSIQLGRLPYCPRNVVRTTLTVPASLEQVTDVLADESLRYLPQWNKEFNAGEILKNLKSIDKQKAWLVQVEYNTPFFLDNRQYVYYFSREWLSNDEVLILYCSVDHESTPPQGVTRALLYPTVHRLTRISNNETRIEHLLATDLCGKLAPKQDSLLKGGLIQAHVRDMASQLKLFSK